MDEREAVEWCVARLDEEVLSALLDATLVVPGDGMGPGSFEAFT